MDIILASGFIPPLDEAYESFGQRLNENLTWLIEVEQEAVAALQRTGIELLPKTPSQRSKKKRKFPSRTSAASRSNSYSRPPSRVTRQKPKSNDATKKSIEGQQPAKEYELPIDDVAMKSLEELPATNLLKDVATPQKETQPTEIVLPIDDRENAPIEAQTVVIDEPPSNDVVEQPIIVPSSKEDVPDSTDIEKKSDIEEQSSPKKLVAVPPPALDEPRMMTRSKARPKVQKIVAAIETLTSPKRAPIKSPLRIVSSANKVRPTSTDKSTGSRFFGFGSATKNMPSTFARTPSYNNLTNLSNNFTSFLKRNTPMKQSKREVELNLKEKLQLQEERQKEAVNKKDNLLRTKIEEQRKKREEREQKVAAARELKKAETEQIKRKFEEKAKAISNLKEYEEQQQKKKQKLFVNDELEKKKRQEEERRKEEAKQKAREQEREEAERIKAAHEAAEAKKKYALETAVKPKKVSPKRNIEAISNTSKQISESRLTFNVSGNAATASASVVSTSNLNSTKEQESYDITPARQHKPSTDTNYDIADLNSSDDTDDEEAPRKKIPFWAQGAALKAAMVQQYYTTIDTDVLFYGALQVPNLLKLFNSNKKRFHHRTSSAIWNEASFQAFCDEDLTNV